MMGQQKYEKLVLGTTKLAGRAVGMKVVADFVDPETKQRVLLLERPELAGGVIPAPKRTRRTPAQMVAAAAVSATAQPQA